jgi:rubrerythrin
MNIEEAIKTAIEYETRVRDVYVEALDSEKDDVAKRVLKLLADEENHHVLYLEAKLGEWIARQQLTFDDLETTVPSVARIQQEVEKLQDAMEAPGDKTRELKLLQKAREVEAETSRFYEDMVAKLPEQGQAFFKRFVEIEAGHMALVQAEIDALNGPGFWFDMPEFELR